MSPSLRLQVFTSLYIGLPPRCLLREAAEAFVRLHPEFSLEIQDLDSSEQAMEIAGAQNVTALPKIRFFRDGKLIGDSSIVVWSVRSMEKWIYERLADADRERGTQIPGR